MQMSLRIYRRIVAGTLLIFGAVSPALAKGKDDPEILTNTSVVDDTKSTDDDEAMEVELRRRALEAEMGIDGAPSNSELVITIEELDQMKVLPGNLGVLPAHPDYPVDNLPTADRINLGRHLYFDLRLSRDHSMSCATCHSPFKGWADGSPRAVGFGKIELGRHSPTVLNTAFNTAQFWDGRAATLEAQAVGPILAAGEMNMPSESEVINTIRNAPEYKAMFQAAYGGEPSMETIGKAIAAFERTIVSGPSRFDDYVGGNKSALSESEKRGLILFTTTASCTACHNGPNFTDSKCHSLGLKQHGPLEIDLGRFNVTKDPKDKFAFKTPGLRNIEQSGPYMHDGSLTSLEQVVEFYDKGGDNKDARSHLIKPLRLTESQQEDLVNFLRSLTGPLPSITIPPGKHYGI
jgi:cytochrome c peroxidase